MVRQLFNAIQIMTYSEVRANLKDVCNKVVNDCDSVTIHRRDGENVVMMSESEFSSWKETLYLMSNPNNAKRLLESIAQAEQGKIVTKDLHLEDY